MNLDGFLWYGGAFLLALGILIVVHELGHFAAARYCGVKVLRFSLGFGRPLLTRRWGRDGTEWSLAVFPLGGYVKMLDEREGPVAPEEVQRSFNRQSVGRRALIVVAGPAANLLLAIVIYWGAFMQGAEELRPVLGSPPAKSIAARAGIAGGDLVRSVAGQAILTWQDLRWELVRRVPDRSAVTLEVLDARNDLVSRVLDISTVPLDALEGDLMPELGLTLFRPRLEAIVDRVATGSVAAAAGIQGGDKVLAIDGRPVADWAELATIIRQSPNRPLAWSIFRDGRQLSVTIVPARLMEGGKAVGRVGIMTRENAAGYESMFVTVTLGPGAALRRAVVQTWETALFSLRMIGRMVVGELSWKNVSGPVTIADYAGQSAHMGLLHYLRFLALISISLGVLNLLPVPILDGGHLMYYLAELIKGGPLPERVMEIGQQIGLALLLLLMAFAFYNDINRLISG